MDIGNTAARQSRARCAAKHEEGERIELLKIQPKNAENVRLGLQRTPQPVLSERIGARFHETCALFGPTYPNAI